MELREIIAKNILELRKINNLTQSDLAKQLNYTDKAISKWERGESIPEISTLKKIASLYNVTLDELTNENGIKIKEEKEQLSQKDIRKNRIIIVSSYCVAVWLAALVVFFYGVYLLYEDQPIFLWQAFLAAIPVTCLVLLFFNKKWGKKKYEIYPASLFIWSTIALIYVITIQYETWIIFLIGIPLQIILILLSQLKK